MLYTEDFSMLHYVGFSQIESHITMKVMLLYIVQTSKGTQHVHVETCTYHTQILQFTCKTMQVYMQSKCATAENTEVYILYRTKLIMLTDSLCVTYVLYVNFHFVMVREH